MAAPNHEALLAAVERSPQAAAAHDRVAWVGLFTGDGRIEDPVGSRPHRGRVEIEDFYHTFIGPREITFHRDLDIVFGTVVLRDLELEVSMGSTVTMYIPAFLRYDLRETNGAWQIARLRAYWELPAMMLRFLRSGPGATWPALQLTRDLLSNQGLAGTAGFLRGFRRPGGRHKKLLDTFLRAVAGGAISAAEDTLSPSAAITLGDDQTLDLAELAVELGGARRLKMIGAGAVLAISLDSRHGRGIMFAELARHGKAINGIRYFPA
ncbi:ketosteroid isomerase family protein [Mycobacterium sherrisii]|uniref:Transporter n=1 Tax=Mycobacterium sherrisii TaxID=243061 RepID=A0A1E3SPQ3_9MYCO|nr:ketosteroid isomerase family protein [Mycobacterium sherrisii]MCV7029298.1 transporter [Mycobacterium sherrisii]MEC4765279.1 ketosteroid isomerase family protein [Mycobacterium sherrisii]ODR04069.1 transporter [Mycobacterium sherrisii]ORW73767.1 transporter [Mycobacterium sherrisii]